MFQVDQEIRTIDFDLILRHTPQHTSIPSARQPHQHIGLIARHPSHNSESAAQTGFRLSIFFSSIMTFTCSRIPL
jgi:hypothetical protein